MEDKIVKNTKEPSTFLTIVIVLFVVLASISISWVIAEIAMLSDSHQHQIYTDYDQELEQASFFKDIDTLDITKNNYPIEITKCKISKFKDYRAYRDVIVKVKNVSDKPIKYITFSLDYYNRVGDKINIPSYFEKTHIIVGTIPPNKTNRDSYCIPYTCRKRSAEYAFPTNVVIVFDDDTKLALPPPSLVQNLLKVV